MNEEIIERIRDRFGGEVLSTCNERGDLTVVIRKDRLIDILAFLKEDSFDMLADLCGVDYIREKPRFEVAYHLYSVSKNLRLRLRVKVPEEEPVLPSATSLWGSADWLEREVFDMFGIRFDGHPNLKRLLLFDGFEGHPLRKDYPMGKRQKIPATEETI